jgi:hypothetical protein
MAPAASSIVTTIPDHPHHQHQRAESVCKPSLSDIPLIRVIIQKALSLSQLTGFEPHPIAIAR